ncbi:transposable element Tcb2 transposase [Trichonephila clavipes]|nr:transposable element Tcb2 transposase [Trichonephila clavipes]
MPLRSLRRQYQQSCSCLETPGEGLNPAFALRRHAAPAAGVMVWVPLPTIHSEHLVLICGTMSALRYVHDFLTPHVLLLMQWLPGAIFQLDNARLHTARVSQDCLHHTVTTLPWSDRSPDLSPIEHIWDHLGR